MGCIMLEFDSGAFGDSAIFEGNRHFTYSKQRTMLQKLLLETTENTWSQRLLKTREVPEIENGVSRKGFRSIPQKGVWQSLHPLVIYHTEQAAHRLLCIEQQLFCML